MSGSKTTYYVSSSTFPMFDDSRRVNQYAAAMLDYTANSPIEHSEYIKSFFNSSRVRNYRGYLNWCKKSGFFDTFGKVNADFYGDAKLDNTVVGNAIKHLIPLGENDTFGVYKSNLSFFSEDFYVKYLATQQGLADKFYSDGDLYYTISYPTEDSIRATLEDGTYVEGRLPTGSSNTRFIEISYSIIKERIEVTYPPAEIPPGGTEPVQPDPIYTTYFDTVYGFYHYQEDTGIAVLDNLIKNNNSKAEKSFFPPIPLRNNTAWFSGTKANKINEALKYLEIRETNSDRETGYDQLKKACSKMDQGSISDIDYITLFLGVHLNSDNNSDQKYLFEFFYNLYINYALKVARPDPTVAKPLYAGSNYMDDFASFCKRGFASAGHTDGYFTKFKINCTASNLNLTYSWGHADYFEQNGKWKPDAKIGDYGVLSGSYTYTYSYTEQIPVTDSEGDPVYEWVATGNIGSDNEEGYYRQVYKTVTRTKSVPYTLTYFCHQTSINRFRLVGFVGLQLTNLIYHGKTIDTTAYEAVNAASGKEEVTFDLTKDFSEDYWTTSNINIWKALGLVNFDKDFGKPIIRLKRVTVTGEIDTPFIVPLEQTTFNEIGVRNQSDRAPCSMFLIYNCWVKVKKKWYQRGFFKWVALAVAVVVAVIAPYLAPAIGAAAASAVAIAAWTVAIVITASIVIDLLTKVISLIFGDRIGGMIGGILQSVFNYACATLVKAFGFWSPIGIGIMIGMSVVNSDTAMQNGAGFGEGLLKGFGNTAINVGAAYAAGQFNNPYIATAVQVGIGTFGQTYIETGSFSQSLKAGAIGAATAALAYGIADVSGFTKAIGNIGIKDLGGTFTGEGITAEAVFDTASKALSQSGSKVLSNPNTYANLLNMGIQEYYEHKLKNLKSDYQEFTNNLQAAQDALDVLNACMLSTATAEFVTLMQTNLGRMIDIMPEVYLTLTPDQFMSMALSSGSDVTKQTLAGPSTFVDSKLTMEGYAPSTLYYTQTDPTILWDVT